MKIAYICLDPGIPIYGNLGASVHIRETVAAFERLGHEVVVFSPNINKNTNSHYKITAVDIKDYNRYDSLYTDFKKINHILDIDTRLWSDFRLLMSNTSYYDRFKAIFSFGKFDFIYERYSLFNYSCVTLSNKYKIPHILEVNAPLVEEFDDSNGIEIKNYAKMVESKIFNHTNLLIAVSDKLKKYAVRLGVTKQRILTLPNAVDVDRFKPDEVARKEIRSRLKLKDKIVIGFVGSIRVWHDIDTLIDAFIDLHQTNPDIHLLIVGNGPKRIELEKLLELYNMSSHVTWLGYVDHLKVPSYICAMDIAVAPYYTEKNGYHSPIKIFEYMACEKIIVAAHNTQINKIIGNKEMGILYESGNKSKLVNALKKVMKQPELRQIYGKNARQWVTQNRTWDINAESILRNFSKISNYDKSTRNIEHFIITRFGFTKLDTTSINQSTDETSNSEHELETRFLLFESFCLPSILGQVSKGFYWIIVIDENLPEHYVKRLQNLIKNHHFIHLIKDDKNLKLHRTNFIEDKIKNIGSKYIITTRLNDCDSLCSNFTEFIKYDYQKHKNDDMLFISYPKGLSWTPLKNSEFGLFSVSKNNFNASGLSLITVNKKYPLTIYRWSHKQIISMLEQYRKDQKSSLNIMANKHGDDLNMWDMESKVKLINTKENVYIRTMPAENDKENIHDKMNQRTKTEIDLNQFALEREKIVDANKFLTFKKP